MTKFALHIHRYRLLLIILVSAFAVRGMFAFRSTPAFSMDPDSYSYQGIALNLLNEGHFTNSAARTPGYPVFIAFVYKLFGNSSRAITCTQALIGTGTVFLVYLIAAAAGGAPTGLIAAAIAACDPFQVYFTGKVLTETWFAFFLCLLTLLLQKYSAASEGRLRIAVCIGVVSALGAYLRAEMLGLCAVVAAFYGIQALTRREKWRELLPVLIIILVPVVLLLPWAARNKMVMGRFIMTSTVGGWALFEGLAQDYSIEGWERYRRENMNADIAKYNLDTELKVNDHFNAKARRTISAHPGEFLSLSVRKMLKMYRIVPYEVFSSRTRMVSVLYFLPLLAFFLIGLFISSINYQRLVPVLLPIIIVTGLHMVLTSQIRYRVPLHPLMAVIAAGGIAGITRKLSASPGRL